MVRFAVHPLLDPIMRSLRLLSILFALCLALPAFTEEAAPGEAEVIIHEGKDKTIHEYRINGFTYAVKVIPKNGKPIFWSPPTARISRTSISPTC